MARKKSGINNRIISVVIAGVVLLVVVPVVLLVFGIGYDTSPAEGFEIPVSDQEQIETNQELIDQANDLLCGGGGTGDPDQIQILSDGTILDPNQVACIPQGETNSEGEEVSPEEIDEMIEEIEEMIVDPPIENQTTSEDPPLEQSCDIDPDNPLCQIISPSNSLQLISKVEKTDSQGVTTVSEEIFEVPALAFLVEDPTDRDFRTGFINFQLFLKGIPDTMYVGTGNIDIFVGNQSTKATTIEINGISDTDGMVQIQFVSPTGTLSDALLFTFDDEFDKFGNEQVTLMRLNVQDISVSDQTENFSLVDQDVFTLDIARDDIKLIIIDETGEGTDRVYPTDSRILITSKAKTIRGTQCLIYQSLVDQLGTGCSARNLSCPCIGSTIGIGTNNVVAGTTSPPSITGINLFDQNGQFLLSQIGGSSGVVFDELVTRNENYTLQILSPVMSTDLSFGKPQETQSYTCVAEGTARHKINVVRTGVLDRCGAGLCNYYYWIITDGVTTRATTCNFP
jgi:hypothetical protein